MYTLDYIVDLSFEEAKELLEKEMVLGEISDWRIPLLKYLAMSKEEIVQEIVKNSDTDGVPLTSNLKKAPKTGLIYFAFDVVENIPLEEAHSYFRSLQTKELVCFNSTYASDYCWTLDEIILSRIVSHPQIFDLVFQDIVYKQWFLAELYIHNIPELDARIKLLIQELPEVIGIEDAVLRRASESEIFWYTNLSGKTFASLIYQAWQHHRDSSFDWLLKILRKYFSWQEILETVLRDRCHDKKLLEELIDLGFEKLDIPLLVEYCLHSSDEEYIAVSTAQTILKIVKRIKERIDV